MMAMCRTAEISAVTQPPFLRSFPADSMSTSSNIAANLSGGAVLRFRDDANYPVRRSAR